MDKLNVLVTRATGLMGQKRLVTDRQTDGRIVKAVFFFAKRVLFCAFVMLFFAFFVFAMLSSFLFHPSGMLK